ncbi:MAG: hypothetical protein A2Z16_05195 [Chloroflexi bacterium RBG_16_54_18]|nr:MAG: hypothetical protein A2Z16_05195 [Chloroflexi bacterium RBG_16_54_18]
MRTPNTSNSINRRQLLRMAGTLGGLAALSSFLEACSKAGLDLTSASSTSTAPTGATLPATSAAKLQNELTSTLPAESAPVQYTTTPTSTETGYSKVAFVKTGNRTEGVHKAIDLLKTNPVAGKNVFIKPNFNSADPTPGSTHPDVLTALVLKLKEMGAVKITVGDRSGMGDTHQVMGDLGIFDLAEKLGFDLVILDDLTQEDWVMFTPVDSHWKSGFPFASPCLEAGSLVQTCCLKTHRYGGQFTLSLKNSVGMVAKKIPSHNYDFMNELHTSRHQRRMIAEINTAYTPNLIVLDGVEAFISGGPDNGQKVSSQVILAGTDRIAIDAVGVALLRYHGCQTEVAKGKIFEQEQIARAVELGLGVDSPTKIQLLPADQESAAYAEDINYILSQG